MQEEKFVTFSSHCTVNFVPIDELFYVFEKYNYKSVLIDTKVYTNSNLEVQCFRDHAALALTIAMERHPVLIFLCLLAPTARCLAQKLVLLRCPKFLVSVMVDLV